MKMDDFLADINEQLVETHLLKLKDLIHWQQSEMIKKLREQSQQITISKKNKHSSDHDELQNSVVLFTRACQNILHVYFALLIDEEYLCLQSQQQIIQKIHHVKALIQKNTTSLLRRLNKITEEEEVPKEKKIQKATRKGKNSKIPFESTSIMQKWLLQNFTDPYPSHSKKQQMAKQSNLSAYQVNNWFINARQRVIKRFLKKEVKDAQKSHSRSDGQEEEEQSS